SVKVTIAASNKFKEKAPEIADFLSKYHTSSKLTSEALAHMQETGDNYNATAKWFLKNNDNLIDQWLTADKAAAVRKALN
ncbi:MAG: glycine betaine ABC transporter substrate-binding protein, partial [Fusobacterium varium]